MTALELCSAALDNIVNRTRTDQSTKGIRSSGHSADSLKKEMRPDGGDMVGDHYIYQQIAGRRPGKQPPLENIIDWIQRKGIEVVDISLRGLAFVIARKIAQRGTDIFAGIREALGLHDIVADEANTMAKEIGKNAVQDLLAAFRSLKTTNN